MYVQKFLSNLGWLVLGVAKTTFVLMMLRVRASASPAAAAYFYITLTFTILLVLGGIVSVKKGYLTHWGIVNAFSRSDRAGRLQSKNTKNVASDVWTAGPEPDTNDCTNGSTGSTVPKPSAIALQVMITKTSKNKNKHPGDVVMKR